MSRWKRWQHDLHKKVKELEDTPFADEDDEEHFFEIELGLRLHDHIFPDVPYTEIWPLLTGYMFAGINDREDRFAMCMKARIWISLQRTGFIHLIW